MEEPYKISPEAQQVLMHMQSYQQQMQALMMQKDAMSIQRIELENALEEVKKLKEKDDVFKAVGPVLIKTSKNDMEKDLAEKIEEIEIRTKSFDKQEEKIREKLKEGQKKIQEILKEDGHDHEHDHKHSH